MGGSTVSKERYSFQVGKGDGRFESIQYYLKFTQSYIREQVTSKLILVKNGHNCSRESMFGLLPYDILNIIIRNFILCQSKEQNGWPFKVRIVPVPRNGYELDVRNMEHLLPVRNGDIVDVITLWPLLEDKGNGFLGCFPHGKRISYVRMLNVDKTRVIFASNWREEAKRLPGYDDEFGNRRKLVSFTII